MTFPEPLTTDPRKADPQTYTEEPSELRAIQKTDGRKSDPGSLLGLWSPGVTLVPGLVPGLVPEP